MRTSVLIAAAAIVIVFAETPKSEAVGSQSSHWFNQMDRDKNGSVSRTEFVQFMSRRVNRVETRFLSQRFNRLDTNHNGRLEGNELRPSAGKWLPHHHR
jgi:Ca2+-binding EF-hand superfamily protein